MNELIHKVTTDPQEVTKLREERPSNVATLAPTAAAYVQGLAEQSLTHRAVRHPT